MEKEIYEQPDAILNTIDGRVGGDDVLENIFGLGSSDIFQKVKRVQIVACGTSLHAGRVAANWFSAISELPTQIDYASEYRYRNPHVDEDSLLVTISQSGETEQTHWPPSDMQKKKITYLLFVYVMFQQAHLLGSQNIQYLQMLDLKLELLLQKLLLLNLRH